MERQIAKYWGHECDLLSQNLFRVISGGVKFSRVYFAQFIEKFYNILTNEVYRERMKFCFNIFDVDQDGILKA